MWYYWVLIMAVLVVTCLVLAAYWWHKFKEMFLRGIYFVTGFLSGAVTVFVLLLIFGKINW